MIYAQSVGSRAVSLTIQLVGENTIVCDSAYYGIYVDAEMSNDSYGTDASLTITGNGSLEVSGSSYGIWVKSGTGNASLNIKNVAVTSSTNGDYAAGVCVQSSTKATGSPQLSLAVDGGSLTTSASEGNDGIQFYVGLFEATGATTSLTVSDNAIVRANGGIKASRVDEPTPSGTGIVFDGTEGTVYGNVELQKDLEIKSGETLTIGKDASLNANGNLTNNGTINVESGGSVTGSLSDNTQVTTPTITNPPSDQTVIAGSTATFAVTASNVQSYQWQQRTNSGSDWTDISQATSASYTTVATTTDMSGYQYRCMVKSASGVSVISSAATLMVNEPITYTITANASPAEGGSVTVNNGTSPVSVAAGNEVTLTATANSGYRFTGWTSSNGDTFADPSSASTTFTMPANDVTVTAGFEKYYTITAAADSSEGGTVDGGGDYAAGSSVTLNATANSGYRFVCWLENDQQVALMPPVPSQPAATALSQQSLKRSIMSPSIRRQAAQPPLTKPRREWAKLFPSLPPLTTAIVSLAGRFPITSSVLMLSAKPPALPCLQVM